MRSQRASQSGSRLGSPARIGNVVFGRFSVSLYSGIWSDIWKPFRDRSWTILDGLAGAEGCLKRRFPAALLDQSAGHVIRFVQFFTKFIGRAYRAQMRRGPDPSPVGSVWRTVVCSSARFVELGLRSGTGGAALLFCVEWHELKI